MHEMLKQTWESFAIQGEIVPFLEILDMDFMDIDEMPYESYAFPMD